MTSAAQIQLNAYTCAFVNASWNKNTPNNNVNVGAIYWRNPSMVSEIRLAPFAKYKSGTAVAGPAPINNNACQIVSVAKSEE